ncbi:MAG TPA: bifunctional [glutamate--ammonia ligase]-adenylyl-L-tyrosine phosphorylase/[glutamate--ammonia-ligase] adenylyltransferase, partial [Rhodanobacteraceae bacterium]|nr:bifunctional [glutamate--ammonia ligase]-adenylyl-L-tyrosine phosphorylase/[glutamate--ammonia-ligase] adenylyltransferase [Rhodanobacteraceae bacterium]
NAPLAVAQWRRALLGSDFVFDVAKRQPNWLAAAGWQRLSGPRDGLVARINAALAGIEDNAAFMAALRRVRHGEALRLAFRALNEIDEVEATVADTSAVYRTLAEAALRHAETTLALRHGLPRDGAGKAQRLVVIGMGKLGGGELNFSSDIDLILAYPEAGESDGARPLANEEYFARLGREMVRLLAEPTVDGIVARVDLRLRPFGQAGRLALSFAAMELYYQREGRDWERYAWIKAAPIAGDLAAGAELMETLRPFIYRKYLDYTAFAGLREMKALIDAEVVRKDLTDNLKLGPGGIREIEFLVQLQQLIRGGREPSLRVRGLLAALAACTGLGLIDAATAAELRASYLFLRRLENAAQMFADRQIHEVEPEARERVAQAGGYASWSQLERDLSRHRERVQAHFTALLLPGDEAAQSGAKAADTALWQQARADALPLAALSQRGFVPADAACQALLAVARAPQVGAMSPRSSQRLDRLMPELIAEAAESVAPLACLTRLTRLVQAVARRSSYLALLDEQPAARKRLVELFADSAFLAERVIQQPLLLDDVLDPRIDHLPLRRTAVAAEIERTLVSLDERHSEADLERINETRASLAFRLGLAYRDGRASAPETSRRLAALADAVVAQVLALARRELVVQHGELPDAGFAVLGYGSLGSGELGFASDLDLVFVYAPAAGSRLSDGPRPLEGMRWYQRLAQRVVHWLGTPLRGGRLYEIDTRLRPDGSKGLLVTSLPAFIDYQRDRAWTWEHQALLRARGVAGDSKLLQEFASARTALLCRPREAAQVRHQVIDMRQRWRKERDRSTPALFDLKQGSGGLLDLDFLLQGLVLIHAAERPALTAGQGATAWLSACRDADLFDSTRHAQLAAAHATLLRASLSCTLDGRPRLAPHNADLTHASASILAAARGAGFDFGKT